VPAAAASRCPRSDRELIACPPHSRLVAGEVEQPDDGALACRQAQHRFQRGEVFDIAE